MRLRPHLGTLLFPPVALWYLGSAPRWGSDEAFLVIVAVLGVFAVLAIISWGFLRRYPTIGVFYSACLVLLYPYTQGVTDEAVFQVLLGGASAVGMVGVTYFAIRGVRHGPDRRRPKPRGFPVIPEAARAPAGGQEV